MFTLKRKQWPILLVNLVALSFFIVIFLSRHNYEFVIYVLVIILLGIFILLSNKKVNYPNALLWLLTIWAIGHMAGGGLYLNDKKIYELIIIPLVGQPYYILKYDQLIHAYGFGVTTFLSFLLLKPLLKDSIKKWTALSIVLVMAGLGFGALNEIIEFIATVLVPETGVGGYINTALDLVFNLIGAILAILFIRYREIKSSKHKI